MAWVQAKRRKPAPPADPMRDKLKKAFLDVYEAVEDVTHEEHGYQTCGMFLELPSKKLYPSYCAFLPISTHVMSSDLFSPPFVRPRDSASDRDEADKEKDQSGRM
jgi:hypothetical protein